MLYLQSTATHSDTTVAIHAFRILASAAVCVLSFFEHGRSITPSTILILYLLASITCQSLQLEQDGSTELGILAAGLGLKFALLVAEVRSKHAYLRQPYVDLSPEQTTSSISRAFLFWLNDLILLGNSKLLAQSDLPRLDDGLTSKPLRERMEDMWLTASKSILVFEIDLSNYFQLNRHPRLIRTTA